MPQSEKETIILAGIHEVLKALQKGDFSRRVDINYDGSLLNTIGSLLNEHVNNLSVNPDLDLQSSSKNIENFEECLKAFANHDFKYMLPVSENGTIIDAISEGINMLGNDLQSSYVSQNYFSNIYNAVSEILIVIDEEGIIENINKAALKIFNKKRKELIGKKAKILLDNKYSYIKDEILEKFAGGKLSYSFEAQLVNFKGGSFPAFCSISKIFDNSKKSKGYLFIAKDITDQKNKELNDLKLVINTQEKERQRLAFDLHDSLGQELNAVCLYLNSLGGMEPGSDQYLKTLESCKGFVENTIESIRRISFDLMPKSLERFGLKESVHELIKRLQQVCNIKYNPPKREPNLDDSGKTIIFRIIQEFVNNSIKHAPASNIKIVISIKYKIVMVDLTDNGKGFDTSVNYQGNGLKNMKTRLETLEADYHFKSNANGTQLSFSVKELPANIIKSIKNARYENS